MRKSALAEGVMIAAIMGLVLVTVSCIGMLFLSPLGAAVLG
ncbi:hypothetical protein [Dryocola sp. BD626]|jgi:hypothetical protein